MAMRMSTLLDSGAPDVLSAGSDDAPSPDGVTAPLPFPPPFASVDAFVGALAGLVVDAAAADEDDDDDDDAATAAVFDLGSPEGLPFADEEPRNRPSAAWTFWPTSLRSTLGREQEGRTGGAGGGQCRPSTGGTRKSARVITCSKD